MNREAEVSGQVWSTNNGSADARADGRVHASLATFSPNGSNRAQVENGKGKKAKEEGEKVETDEQCPLEDSDESQPSSGVLLTINGPRASFSRYSMLRFGQLVQYKTVIYIVE